MSAKKSLTIEQMITKLLKPTVTRVTITATRLILEEKALRESTYFREDIKWKNNLLVYSENSSYRVEEIYKWDHTAKVFKLWFMYTNRLPSAVPTYEFWCNGCPAETVIEASKSLFPDDPAFTPYPSATSKRSYRSKTSLNLT